MSALGDQPKYLNRPQRYWLVFSVMLVLGLGAYVWINHVLAEPAMAALLAVCAMVLVGVPIVLSVRLQLVREQRDRALARSSATERQMSDLQRNYDLRVDQRVARRTQELQNEIEDLHAREKLLEVEAHHDSLTGLANRNLLADRFHFAVERSKRSGKSLALLMIFLNDFKTVKDNYGRAAEDTVLITMARRLVGAVRGTDTVARLGADQFVLMIESIEDPQVLVHIGQKLIDKVSATIVLENGVLVNNGVSVGLAVYPDDGADMNDLLSIADQALYECKSPE